MNGETNGKLVVFTCECGQRIRAPIERAGTKGRCKTCGRKVIVPISEPPQQAGQTTEKSPPPDHYTSPIHRRGLEGAYSEEDLVTYPTERFIPIKPPTPPVELLAQKKSLFEMLGEILRYPVSDKLATQIFLTGAILFSPLVWKVLVPLRYLRVPPPLSLIVDIIALILAVLFVIVVVSIRLMYFSYLLSIIEKSAEGSPKIPELPVFHTWEQHVADLVKVLAASTIAFAPFLVYAFSTNIELLGRILEAQARGEAPGTQAMGDVFSSLGALALLYATAAFYMPMVLMTLVVTRNFGKAVNPVHIVRSIFRIRREYLTAMFIIFLFLRGSVTLFTIVRDILAFDWFSSMVGYIGEPIIEFYVLVVTMHVIGLLYYRNGDKLGW